MNPLQNNPFQNIPIQGQNQNTTPWWGGSNISGYADAFSTVFGSIRGNAQAPDAVNNYYQVPAEEKEDSSFLKNAIIGLIVVVTVVGGIILYRTKS